MSDTINPNYLPSVGDTFRLASFDEEEDGLEITIKRSSMHAIVFTDDVGYEFTVPTWLFTSCDFLTNIT